MQDFKYLFTSESVSEGHPDKVCDRISDMVVDSYLSKDKFSSLILIGLGSILLAHVFVNTAMTVGLIPVKGLPLPFISAGGTFLITSYLMVGLIMRFSINYSD